MDRYLHLETTRESDVDIIRFVDSQLYEHTVLTRLQDELLHVLGHEGGQRVAIDFQNVEFYSTSLINTLLKMQRDLASHQGALALCAMRDSVRDAFRMLNLDGTVFKIFDSVAEGITQLNAD